MDPATGLTYMQQRYYDPMVGRFLSVDPVEARESGDNFNRYSYAANNPYKFTDPDGRESGAAFRVVNNMTNGGVVEPPTRSGPMTVGEKAIAVGLAAVSAGTALGTGGIIGAIRSLAASVVRSSADDAGDFHAPGDAPAATVIVRGGSGEMPAPGNVFSGSQGGTVAEAAQGVPHGTIRTSTAGEVRANGGQVQVAPEATRSGQVNGQHVNVTEGGKTTTFSEPKPNPVPKPDRIK